MFTFTLKDDTIGYKFMISYDDLLCYIKEYDGFDGKQVNISKILIDGDDRNNLHIEINHVYYRISLRRFKIE